jgi:hypothetical protein
LHGFLFPDTHKGIIVRFADTEEEKNQSKKKFSEISEKFLGKMKTSRRMQFNDRFSPYPDSSASVFFSFSFFSQ